MHFTVTPSRGQSRRETYLLRREQFFFLSSLCSCLCFVLFEDARVVYLPNSVCVIFQCYVSDEVLSSYYWNDNSSFPESKGREEGGEAGDNFPSRPSSLFFLHTYPHSLSTWMLESPVMFSRCPSSERTLTKKKNPKNPPLFLQLLSPSPPHTDLVSSTAHCSVREKPVRGPEDFQDTTDF